MSSTDKPSASATSASKQDDSPAVSDNDGLQAMLKAKDDEIASLKEEIEALKETTLSQQQEIQQLKRNAQQANHSTTTTASAVADSAAAAASDLTQTSIHDIASASTHEKTSSNSKVEARWKNRFQQLVAYKLEHGDCNVPKSYKEDKSLHAWVRTQRESKKYFDKKKKSSMTQERIDALNSIGFQWYLGHKPKDDAWEAMFQTLLQFKQQHGHTRVTATEDKTLYKWVLNQRARHRLLEINGEGKAKGMTWARVEKLSAIDFCWEIHPRRNRNAAAAMSTVAEASTNNGGMIVGAAGVMEAEDDEPQHHAAAAAAVAPSEEQSVAVANVVAQYATEAAASPSLRADGHAVQAQAASNSGSSPALFKFDTAAAV